MKNSTAKERAEFQIKLAGAQNAAWEAGERSRIENGREEWSEEDIDAAAEALKNHLLGDS